jgi:putative heme-binding domain-containing protein
LFGCFDDRGRLYVAEGTGKNLPGAELVKLNLGRITRLEDTDGDGKFDQSTTFADRLVFPQGVLWHDGAVYVASHPAIWRLEDTDDDGHADRREPLVSGFQFTGNGCDIHGPFVGPDGWLYWTDGRHGYTCQTKEGTTLQGLAARVFRCRPDGSGLERIAGGGFDNPVELVWTPQGDLVGTMDQAPGDCLLHYIEGGVYPMEHPCTEEFPMTGPLLAPIRMYPAALPVALCGMTRYRSMQLGKSYTGTYFTAQFNVHRIEQHILVRDGATFRSTERDFVTSTNYDVHFSDVLEDADGSLLLIDMGAWFNYGCPTSKIAKPEVLGAIYRVRRVGATPIADPWGRSLGLEKMPAGELAQLLDDPRPAVRDRVIERLAKLGDVAVPALVAVLRPTLCLNSHFSRVTPTRSASFDVAHLSPLPQEFAPLMFNTVGSFREFLGERARERGNRLRFGPLTPALSPKYFAATICRWMPYSAKYSGERGPRCATSKSASEVRTKTRFSSLALRVGVAFETKPSRRAGLPTGPRGAEERVGREPNEDGDTTGLDQRACWSQEARSNALWSLCRMRTPGAMAAVREVLADPDPSVRQVAAHAAGLERDRDALPLLAQMAAADDLPRRLKAAEAIGRIGRPEGVAALLEAVRCGGADRYLEHALIYALIVINHPDATLAALEDSNPRVRQAGLIALDQMPNGRLGPDQVMPLLDTDDPDLQQAALGVLARHPQWSQQMLGLLRELLAAEKLSDDQQRSLKGALLALCGEGTIQQIVADELSAPGTKPSTRRLLLQVLARCRLEPLPKPWLEALGKLAAEGELEVRSEAVATLKARGISAFDGTLSEISRDAKLPADLRLNACECIVPRLSSLPAELFEFLVSYLPDQAEPLQRSAAARALGSAHLNPEQLLRLAREIATAGPLTVPRLVPAFGESRDQRVGGALVEALKQSPGTDSIGSEELDRLLAIYPPEVQAAAGPLRERIARRQHEQATHLAQLTAELIKTTGDAQRGKDVFFSKKIGCYGCHRAAGNGGNVGPDLSQIGHIRTPRDLLEAIVFPSSSVVPAWQTYVFALQDGRSATGTIVRESSDAIDIRTPQLAEVRIPRNDVQEMHSSPTSIMPEGLEKTMTAQQLADLLEFLYQLR